MRSLPSQIKDFVYGDFIYRYELTYQDRKTLNLTVMPDLKIYVKSPHEAKLERIETFLRKKWLWLEKQLIFFGKYHRKIYKREFVSGESIRYLGKQYQLVVKLANPEKVSLQNGMLIVTATKKGLKNAKVKTLISNWYAEKTRLVLLERFNEMQKKFDLKEVPQLMIRNMNTRWGSCMNKGKIILNPKLIHVSKDCIDYVITHELCHLKYENHDKKFFQLLEEKYPKWSKVKEKLELLGSMVQ